MNASRLLIVDDEPSILTMLRIILQSEGLEVETARNSAEARAILAKQSFDVVITDMRMETPVSGMEVAGFAKASPAKPGVLLLSAFPLQTSEWAGFADAYLQKGGDVRDLIAVVQNLLRVRAA